MDVSANKNLAILYVSNNKLSKMDVNANINLIKLGLFCNDIL